MRHVANEVERRRIGEREPVALDGQGTAVLRRQWREARSFQEQTQRALRNLGVRFVEWLLLETLAELTYESAIGVQQTAVARRAGLTIASTSRWMADMSEDGLVDREPDWDGRGYSILLTSYGADLLRRCNERLLAAGLTA